MEGGGEGVPLPRHEPLAVEPAPVPRLPVVGRRPQGTVGLEVAGHRCQEGVLRGLLDRVNISPLCGSLKNFMFATLEI